MEKISKRRSVKKTSFKDGILIKKNKNLFERVFYQKTRCKGKHCQSNTVKLEAYKKQTNSNLGNDDLN